MTIFGYARVSTADQKLDLQLDALTSAGAVEIETDKQSGGSRKGREGLRRLLSRLSAGDVLVVWRLDRLARSLSDLIKILDEIHGKGAQFRSLTENIDTTTATGEMLFGILGTLAQFERRIIHERIEAGIKAARSRGVVFGRPRKALPHMIDEWRIMREEGRSYREIGRLFRLNASTIKRAIEKAQKP